MPSAIADDDTRIYYQVQGTGEPLLMIMGQGMDHTGWASLADEFAEHYQVITFDHRGTGQSDKPATPAYTTRGMARDAIAILDHLALAQAHVYGISMGGRIGQWLAVDFSARVASLVLACTTPGHEHGLPRPREIDRLFAAGNRERLLTTMVSPEWYAANHEFQKLWQYQSSHRLPGYVQKLHYQASQGHNCWHELAQITAPTLLLHGSEDQVNVPGNSQRLAERIANAELHFIPQGRHFFFLEQRQACNALILNFLRRHSLSVKHAPKPADGKHVNR